MTLRLPKFEYVGARSVAEALDALAEHGPGAMVVAGGTDLYPNSMRRMFTPSVLVGLRTIPELHGIVSLDPTHSAEREETGSSGVRIGSCVSLTELAASPEIRQRFPALASAASLVSTP